MKKHIWIKEPIGWKGAEESIDIIICLVVCVDQVCISRKTTSKIFNIDWPKIDREQMNIDVWSPSLALFLFVGIVGVAVYLKRRKRSIRQQVEDANNGSDDGGELELVEDDDDDSKASYEDLDEGIEWETLDTIDIN